MVVDLGNGDHCILESLRDHENLPLVLMDGKLIISYFILALILLYLAIGLHQIKSFV